MAFAFGIPVKELLATHTSLEIREYMAYEQFAGPIGNDYLRDKIGDLHYMAQWTNYLLGAWATKEGDKNPMPEPKYLGWEPEKPEDDEEEE